VKAIALGIATGTQSSSRLVVVPEFKTGKKRAEGHAVVIQQVVEREREDL
jgi:hypothetical protein